MSAAVVVALRGVDVSDAELIARCNAGGIAAERAFTVLYERYRSWVMRVALRFTGDRELAADVTQEVFIYLLGRFPGFTLTARLTTFLYPAVRNTALTRLRSRHRELPVEAAGELVDEAVDTHPPDDLRRVLAELPDAQREVVLMRFVDDLGLDDIAVALGVPVGTVKSRLHHALRRLADDPSTRDFFGH